MQPIARRLIMIFIAFTAFWSGAAQAAETLPLLRRWVVFPYDAESSLKTAAENAWWKTRERLTNSKKYLVASRQFLVQKDVMQPRRDLNPEDVKLLANLLDADVIVTGYSEHRQFTLNVYLGQDGRLFWTKYLSFHPSLKASDQLELTADKLTQEMLAEIPYQGFTVVDPLIGKPVYDEGGKKYAVVDVGISDDLKPGTDVQWVNVTIPEMPEPSAEKSKGPLLRDAKMSVVAEGKIAKVRRGVVVAEVLRARNIDVIQEKSLVRIPKEAMRLTAPYMNGEVSQERLAPELVPTIINPVAPQASGVRKNTLIFGSIFSIFGILALAL